MKILFIYPNVARAKSPQLGICMIAAVAKRLGHELELYDLTNIPEAETISTFKSQLQRFSPDLLAISCRSNEWSFIKDLLLAVDTINILKVLGGPHATVAPDEAIDMVDIVVMGEGEDTFAEILTKIGSGDDISKIAGTWTKKSGVIIKNEMRNLISDLDELPLPYWKIFDDFQYYESDIKEDFKGSRIIGTFESSRGCPYACTYCTNDFVRTLYKGKGKWRREKSIERIILEVKQFRDQYGLDGIYWIDEIILTGLDRLYKFRDLYSSEIGLPFVFMERPENMTDEKVKIITQAGAKMVSIGIESGDENIRKTLLNRHYSQETIISAFKTARKYGLKAHAFTMVGFPGENRKSVRKTLKLLNDAKPDTVQTSIFFPLTKTILYDKVIKEGLFDLETPMPRDYYLGSSLHYPKKWKREILNWQYLVSNYRKKVLGSFILALPGPIIFRVLIFIRNSYYHLLSIIRKEGLLPMLKAIIRKLSNREK